MRSPGRARVPANVGATRCAPCAARTEPVALRGPPRLVLLSLYIVGHLITRCPQVRKQINFMATILRPVPPSGFSPHALTPAESPVTQVDVTPFPGDSARAHARARSCRTAPSPLRTPARPGLSPAPLPTSREPQMPATPSLGSVNLPRKLPERGETFSTVGSLPKTELGDGQAEEKLRARCGGAGRFRTLSEHPHIFPGPEALGPRPLGAHGGSGPRA